MAGPDNDGLIAAPERSLQPFFSGPLGADEAKRLVNAIDARIHLRSGRALQEPGEPSGHSVPDAVALMESSSPGAAEPDPDALENLAAPLFNVRQGEPAARAIRAVLNLPLRLFGRPQTYFNQEVRRILAWWTRLLRASLDVQAMIQRQIAVQARKLDQLAARDAELERAIVDLHRLLSSAAPKPAHDPASAAPSLPAGASVALGHRIGSRGHLEVRAENGTRSLVAVDPATPPFAAQSVAEVIVRRLIEFHPEREFVGRLLPAWHSLLMPGGLIRIVCCDWEGALDLYRSGGLDTHQLRTISFGEPGAAGHRTMYTRSALVMLLEAAGFVNCSVSLLRRGPQGCPEMEVAGARPLG